MAEKQAATPQPPQPPPGNAAENLAAAQQQAAAGSQQQGQPADPPRAEKTADPTQTVTREIADKLREAAASVAGSEKQLAQNAERLAREANDPVRANQRSFQHELAYAVQDVEKAGGPKLPLSDQARAEVTKLAASAPGLENQRMAVLLSSTSRIGDSRLVQDIRRAAADIGQQADQNTATTRERIENLENRTRLAPNAPTAEPSQTTRPASETAGFRQAAGRPAQPAAQDQTRRPEQGTRPNLDQPIVVETGFTGALMDGIFRAMRPPGSGNTSPFEPAAQPFGARLSGFEEKTRDDQTLRGAETSGRIALETMEGFRNGEGAAVLNRIREAAKTDPGGIAGVLSEMRQGGKFADLRQQFNSALSDERGATAAYDKAASALARYGEDRKAVEQIIAKRPDATNLSAKFETMDKEIGTAASEIPSRRDGKTMLDDLSKQVAEMLQRAVESVKNLFRGPSAGASPSASPS